MMWYSKSSLETIEEECALTMHKFSLLVPTVTSMYCILNLERCLKEASVYLGFVRADCPWQD